MKSIDIKELSKDIIGSLDNFEGDVKQLVDKYNKNIRKCLDVQAVIKTKVMKTTYRHPRDDHKIKAEVKRRRQKESKWNKDLTEYNYMAFYYQRRHVANIIWTAQRNYYHQLLEENKNYFKAVSNIANKLLFRNDSLPFPPSTSVQDLADDFIDFFTENIDKIMVNLIPAYLDQTDSKYIEKNLLSSRQFNTFRTVMEEDVKVAIRDAPSKHCEFHPILTTLL